ncbi:uncharacterized protein B0H64DRAFT_143988 [Chaetomium fimeti]|uniref:Myb-like domain-containing protein n=1 Tax=Chaetomium fimeti TaxID=1854472 RepID=A0AAE0HFC7_9PEZI|nr:hypothetical protein B0H64DRAFT_143988 [Chaetomium fimeti]
MTRTRRPPRRPNRDMRSAQGPEEASGVFQPPSSEAQGGGYRLIAAQQPSTTAGPGPIRYPPLPAAPPPPSSHNMPSASAHTQFEPPAVDEGDGSANAAGQELIGDETATLAEYPYSIYNHGTWTAEDDKTLIQARSRGQNWADLQRTHFPTKTANACRKRYERLVERRGIHDYSGRRLEMVASEYMTMRKDVWSGLADRVGMKWEVVEALCMGAGLRTIQSNARSYTNRARRDSRISQKTREAQADVLSTGSVGLPLPLLPVGSEFGTAFTNHGVEPDRSSTAADRSMPPPPFFPSSGPTPSTRLPPMALAPQVPFRGYPDGNARLMSGPPNTGAPAPEPPPGSGPPIW